MKRLVSLITLACALAACSEDAPVPVEVAAPAPAEEAAAPPAPATDALTPQGWGLLRIGMTLEDVTAALGPDSNPDAVGGPDPESCDEFRPERAPEGMRVMIQQGVLTRISIDEASSTRTDRGFGVGDTAATVKAGYGPEAVATPHKYQDAPAEYVTVWSGGPRSEYVEDSAARGIVYEIDGRGLVGAIHAGGPSIQYVEGCA